MTVRTYHVGPLTFKVVGMNEDTVGMREDDVPADSAEYIHPAEIAPQANGYTTEDGYDADDVEDWDNNDCPGCGNDLTDVDLDETNGFCPFCGEEI